MKDEVIVTVDPDLEDLIPLFMENTQKDMATISRALAEGDRQTVRNIAHSMKSYGAGYGFDYISMAGKAMEKAALEDNDAVIYEFINGLEQYLEKVKVVYG